MTLVTVTPFEHITNKWDYTSEFVRQVDCCVRYFASSFRSRVIPVKSKVLCFVHLFLGVIFEELTAVLVKACGL